MQKKNINKIKTKNKIKENESIKNNVLKNKK